MNYEQKELEDETILKNIINLNGNEKFNLEGNKLTWYTKGKDIYYQGKTELESPIDINIKYYLNDKEMNPKKMVGKKGKVSIKVNITNREYNTNYNLHTPFVVNFGTTMLNKNNTNIEVSNGSVVDTGTNSMIVSLAAPGLYEDLKIEELKKLNEITINYNTTDFKLNNLYFVATPKLLDKVDVNKINNLNMFVSSVNTISLNMNKLESGSKTLFDSLLEFKNGTTKLKQGSIDLNTGLNNLKNGIEMLDSGAINLNQGLVYMYNQTSNLNKTILNMGFTEETIINLNNLKILDEELYKIKNSYYTYGLKDLTEENIMNLSLSEKEKTELIKAKRLYEENEQLVELGASNYPAINNLLTLTNYFSKLNELEYALNNLVNGSSELSLEISNSKNGIYKLSEGSKQLLDGINQLDKGTDALTDGTKILNLGIETLNNQGIKVLNNYANILNAYLLDGKKLINLSKNYNGFASNNSTSTVFIYKVKGAK